VKCLFLLTQAFFALYILQIIAILSETYDCLQPETTDYNFHACLAGSKRETPEILGGSERAETSAIYPVLAQTANPPLASER
jgi:hypothetical protein